MGFCLLILFLSYFLLLYLYLVLLSVAPPLQPPAAPQHSSSLQQLQARSSFLLQQVGFRRLPRRVTCSAAVAAATGDGPLKAICAAFDHLGDVEPIAAYEADQIPSPPTIRQHFDS